MKRILLGVLGVSTCLIVAPVSFASAADMAVKAPPPPPPSRVFSWTGFYIGANAGGHWDTDQITAAADPVGFGLAGIDVPALDSTLATSLHPQGFIGGGQIGYNWQSGYYVVGLEADANGLTGSAGRTITGAPLIATGLAPGDFVTDSAEATFLTTFRARCIAPPWASPFDRTLLLYATGGGAWGQVKTTD